MKPLIAAALAASVAIVAGAHAATALLSEQQARARAIAILQGDPYGSTPAAVAKVIRDARLARDGNTRACGPRKVAAWEFHVVVVTPHKDQFNNGVIDGYLALDARTGKLLCANLPLLD
jgi:hypothetical protein